jgi:hypothetical protein
MDNQNAKQQAIEMEAKKRAYENQAKAGAPIEQTQGAMLNTYDQPCRTSLRDRIESQLNRARTESRKVERLDELAFLLSKNPDVARILDLLEDVRG